MADVKKAMQADEAALAEVMKRMARPHGARAEMCRT